MRSHHPLHPPDLFLSPAPTLNLSQETAIITTTITTTPLAKMPVEKGEWWTSREEARDVLIEQLRDHLSAAGHRGLVGVHWDMTIICISCIGASEPRTALDLLDQLPLEPGDAHICTSRMSRQERIHILENHGSLFLNCLARPSLLRGVGYFAIDGYPIQVHVLEAVIMPFERGRYAAQRLDWPREEVAV